MFISNTIYSKLLINFHFSIYAVQSIVVNNNRTLPIVSRSLVFSIRNHTHIFVFIRAISSKVNKTLVSKRQIVFAAIRLARERVQSAFNRT